MTIKKPTLGKHCNESDTTNQTSFYNGRPDEYNDDANVNTRTHTHTQNNEMRKRHRCLFMYRVFLMNENVAMQINEITINNS